MQLTELARPVHRIQQNILAAAERRLLGWLCAHLPAKITPDVLTAIGVLGSIAVAAGYALSPYKLAWLWLAIAGFCINWFGDSLDGSLARFRKIERPRFGYFIDHSLDAIGNLAIALGLGLSVFVRLDVALFAISGYLLLSIHTFLAARLVGEFRLSYLAGGPTELRLVLIAMTLLMLATGPQPLQVMGWPVFDVLIGSFGAVLILLFVLQTARIARQLYLCAE
jgi:phosphatidylglycerophosphate synthase